MRWGRTVSRCLASLCTPCEDTCPCSDLACHRVAQVETPGTLPRVRPRSLSLVHPVGGSVLIVKHEALGPACVTMMSVVLVAFVALAERREWLPREPERGCCDHSSRHRIRCGHWESGNVLR